MTFQYISLIFIPPKLDMNTFSDSISLWRLLVHSELLHVILWCYRGPQSASGVGKLVKLTYIMNFGHFSYFFIPPNLDMNAFSGSISVWRLLVHSEHLHIWYHRGSQSAPGVGKLVKINQYYDFWALFVHFHTTKVRYEYIF